jgi:two-component system OmpR family response regulator
MGHTKPCVLVVDDDESIRSALSDYLQDWDFRVCCVADGDAMDQALRREKPDVVVLDVMLPGEDGLSICRRLQREIPVLVLSALGNASDRVLGLELGADDYLPKPFEPRELLARLRAIMRRKQRSIEARKLLLVAGWTLDDAARELRDPNGQLLPLTSGNFALLHAFASYPQRLLSRARLLHLTQGPLGDPFDRAIDLAVSRLRCKLRARGCDHWIETVWSEGYKFTVAVESRDI